MGIKPDHWIRRMANDHKMIEPFVESSVRNGVISYGVSSYGYDIRVSNEFKVFTNVNSAVVDPKNFVPQSFIDLTTDVCIIPPNSFALSRTVEYFRIPREVLVICLGKCLSGDTRVVDAETGDFLPIRDFVHARRTVSLEGWRTCETGVTDWIPQGTKPVYVLTTRMGMRIKATANHPFRQLYGWTPLSDLKPGDRIAAARHIPVFGRTPLAEWEAALLGMMTAEGQYDTPGHSPTFTTSDPVMADLLRRVVREGLGCDASHNGAMGYRIVNRKGRGGVMTGNCNRATVWLKKYHLNVRAAGKFVPRVVFTAPRDSVSVFLRALFTGDGSVQQQGDSVHIEYYSMSRRLIEDVHHLLLRFGIVSLIREKRTHLGSMSYRIQITDIEQAKRFADRIGFWPGSVKQKRLETVCATFLDGRPRGRSNFDTLPIEAMPLMRGAAASVGASMRSLGVEGVSLRQSLSFTHATRIAEAVPSSEVASLVADGPTWDVVESIEYAGEEEVFDLSVPGAHNFVANDLFVHNSTYARCFRGDTRVALVDGTSPTLEEMARLHDKGEMFWGYSVGEHGRIIVTLLDAPRFVGRDSLLRLTLDNGQTIECTPDHGFIRRDGRMAQAHELRPNDSLMPLYRQLVRGYESVYQPVNAFLLPTHRLADEWNLRNGIYGDAPNTHRHHVDHDRLNNAPWNITRLPAEEHIRHHNAETYGDDFDPAEHSAAIRASLARLKQDDHWYRNYTQQQRKRARGFWDEAKYAAIRHQWLQSHLAYWASDESREAQRDRQMAYWESNVEARESVSERSLAYWQHASDERHSQQREIARNLRLRNDISAESVRAALDATGSIRAAARMLNCDRSVFRRFPQVVRSFKGQEADNHKVAKVEEIKGTHDVYCLTVPEAGNFALEAGVFVSNCGLIVNVTPLEPEWAGHLTLEISNTTPLPAKVYANEGIAQLLFLAGDGICEQSYKDKKGKYQGQVGVTLPRIEASQDGAAKKKKRKKER